MSDTKGWLKEFYPVSAREAADNPNNGPAELVAHCRLKWQGLLPDNLAKYGLKMHQYNDLMDDTGKTVLWIEFNSCALCIRYANTTFFNECKECPLYQHLGQSCDKGLNSLYVRSLQNPSLMVEELDKVTLEINNEHHED